MYRTIDTQVWNDPKVKKLRPTGKLVFAWLITNDHSHSSGLYHLPLSLALHELGIGLEIVQQEATVLERLGLIRYDHHTETVWVRRMVKHQGHSAKFLKGVARHLKSMAYSPLAEELAEEYGIDFTPSRDDDHDHDPYADLDTIPHTVPKSQSGTGSQSADSSQQSDTSPTETDGAVAPPFDAAETSPPLPRVAKAKPTRKPTVRERAVAYVVEQTPGRPKAEHNRVRQYLPGVGASVLEEYRRGVLPACEALMDGRHRDRSGGTVNAWLTQEIRHQHVEALEAEETSTRHQRRYAAGQRELDEMAEAERNAAPASEPIPREVTE